MDVPHGDLRDSGVEVPGQRRIADGIYMGLGDALFAEALREGWN